jgi:Uma2 family endonuclease
MSVMAVMPRDTYEWTVDDLDAIPDDGLQYELIDGVLVVSPAPVPRHQRVLRELFKAVEPGCPPDLEVFFAPLDFRPDSRNSLQPDLMVVRRSEIGEKNIQVPPLLAVEVLSPSTRRKDVIFKRSVYQDWGVASLWYVDPADGSFSALDLVDGRYVDVASAVGEQAVTVALPYQVRVCPADLLRG